MAATAQTLDPELAMVIVEVCLNVSVLDFLMRTDNIREEGKILTGEVYVAVKLTVTCECTAPQEAEEGQRKGGPEHDGINVEAVTRGEEFENALEDKKGNGQTVAPG